MVLQALADLTPLWDAWTSVFDTQIFDFYSWGHRICWFGELCSSGRLACRIGLHASWGRVSNLRRLRVFFLSGNKKQRSNLCFLPFLWHHYDLHLRLLHWIRIWKSWICFV